MRNKVILCLKTAWFVAALMILLTGTNMCVSTDEACFAAGETMFLFMFLLSFPFGVVFLFLSMIFLGSESVHYPSDYITAWFIMACGGCCQWFIVVPRLFAKPTLTVLDLRQSQRPSAAISPPSNVPSPSLIETSQSHNLQSADPVINKIRTRKVRSGIVPFDRRGRTPLERVINRL
ncbi:MAG TPA: hypothetical protein DC054_23585 [Blastocatellia bacterium]|nr:hypothetical protein [Blastocatellia bacterium]